MLRADQSQRAGWMSDAVARKAFGLSDREWRRCAAVMEQEGAVRCARKGWPIDALGLALRVVKMERHVNG